MFPQPVPASLLKHHSFEMPLDVHVQDDVGETDSRFPQVQQVVEIATRTRERNRDRSSDATLRAYGIYRRTDFFGGRRVALTCFPGCNLQRDGVKLLLIALCLASQHRQYLLRI